MTAAIAPVQPLNVPSKPQTAGASSGRNQKDRRYFDTFFDQHRFAGRFPMGRPWTGTREIAANRDAVPVPHDGFVGVLVPGEHVQDDQGNVDRGATFASVWSAPWVPLEKYWKFNYPRKTISFEYAKMRMEEQLALEQYYEAAALLGAELNIRVEYGVMPHFQITAKLGRPSKMITIAEAAMAGDPWLLGFKNDVNPQLAEILGYTTRGLRRITSFVPEGSTPLITPAEVLSTPPSDLLRRLEALEAENAALREKKAKGAAQIAKARAARGKGKSASKPAGVASDE